MTKLSLDLNTKTIQNWNGSSLSELKFKRRDNFELYLKFVDSNIAQELDIATTGKVGIKKANDFSSGFLASDLGFEKTTLNSEVCYKFELNLSTLEIDTAFSTEQTQISCMLEFEWKNGIYRETSLSIPVIILNDIIRGDEINVSNGAPLYPAPNLIELLANKSVAGGYCGLDANSKVPVLNLPTQLFAIQYVATPDNQTDFSMFDNDEVPATGIYLSFDQYSIHVIKGGWTKWRQSVLTIKQ